MRPQTARPTAEGDAASDAISRRPGGPPAAVRPRPPAAVRPVFVDPSGRRQRRVRRLGRLLAIPAAGYAALLLSTALGGPSVDSPYLPLPEAGTHRADPPAAGGGRTPAAATKHGVPGTGAPVARPATDGAAPSGVSPRPTTPPATPPGASTPASASPTGAASPGPSASAVPTVTHGKSTATHPVPTHTGHGRP